MFLLTCPTCRQDHLVGPRSVRRLHNVRPGVIIVELACPRGHRVLELTGKAVGVPGAVGARSITGARPAAEPRRADVLDRCAG